MLGQGRSSSYCGIERRHNFTCPTTGASASTQIVIYRPYTRLRAIQKDAFPYKSVRRLGAEEEKILQQQLAPSRSKDTGSIG